MKDIIKESKSMQRVIDAQETEHMKEMVRGCLSIAYNSGVIDGMDAGAELLKEAVK